LKKPDYRGTAATLQALSVEENRIRRGEIVSMAALPMTADQRAGMKAMLARYSGLTCATLGVLRMGRKHLVRRSSAYTIDQAELELRTLLIERHMLLQMFLEADAKLGALTPCEA
jgi:hypothetical protein